MLHVPSNSIGPVVPLYGAGPSSGGGPPPPTFDGPRDAHRIVVGIATAPYNDTAPNDADFVDAGDGAGLTAALAAAGALGVPVDIRIRPGQIALSVAVTIPSGCSLTGAGRGQTTIVGPSGVGVAQRAILMGGPNCTVRELTITSPQAPGGEPLSDGLIESTFARTTVEYVDFEIIHNGLTKNLKNAVHFTAPTGCVARFLTAVAISPLGSSQGAVVEIRAAPTYPVIEALPFVAEVLSGTRLASVLDSNNFYHVMGHTFTLSEGSSGVLMFACASGFSPGGVSVDATVFTPGPSVTKIMGTGDGPGFGGVLFALASVHPVAVIGTSIRSVSLKHVSRGAPFTPIGFGVVFNISGGAGLMNSQLDGVSAVVATYLVVVQTVDAAAVRVLAISAAATLGSGPVLIAALAGSIDLVTLRDVIADVTIQTSDAVNTILLSGRGTVTDNGADTEVGHWIDAAPVP